MKSLPPIWSNYKKLPSSDQDTIKLVLFVAALGGMILLCALLQPMSQAIQQAIGDYLDHITAKGETKRAARIRDVLENGMYPIKYVYLLILENHLQMDEGLRHLERMGLQDPVARVRHLIGQARAGRFGGQLHISGFLFPEETFCGASGWSANLLRILFRELPDLEDAPIICQSCRRTDAFKAHAGQTDSIKNRNSRWFWKHRLKQAKENGLLP